MSREPIEFQLTVPDSVASDRIQAALSGPGFQTIVETKSEA